MSGLFKAFRAAREQQRREREYADFQGQPMSERLLEHVQNVVNRTGQPMFVKVEGDGKKSGIEVWPKHFTDRYAQSKGMQSPDESKYNRAIIDHSVDLEEILEAAAKRADDLGRGGA